MKNVLKQISIWICAFFIVSASFFLGFSCSLMSYEYYKESNIASASIVEEDYDVLSFDVGNQPLEIGSFGYNAYPYPSTSPSFRYVGVYINDFVCSQTSVAYSLSLFSRYGDTWYTWNNSINNTSYSFDNELNSSKILGSYNLLRFTGGTGTGDSGASLHYSFSYTLGSSVGFSTFTRIKAGMIVNGSSGLLNSYYNSSYFTNNYLLFQIVLVDENNSMLSWVFETKIQSSFALLDGFNFTNIDYYTANVDSYLNFENGYNQGFSSGRTYGYSLGYNEGVESANSYSFLGLFGAIIDAPVQAFTSLFDYELLGFNIKSFLMALLTCSIVIWLIKVVTGKAGG